MEVLTGLMLACQTCFKPTQELARQNSPVDQQTTTKQTNELHTRISVLETKLDHLVERIKHLDSRESVVKEQDMFTELYLIKQTVAFLEKCIEDGISRRSVEQSIHHSNDILTLKIENINHTLSTNHQLHKEQVAKELHTIQETIQSCYEQLKMIKEKLVIICKND